MTSGTKYFDQPEGWIAYSDYGGDGELVLKDHFEGKESMWVDWAAAPRGLRHGK